MTISNPSLQQEQAVLYEQLCVACRNASDKASLSLEINELLEQELDLFQIEHAPTHNRSCLFSLINNSRLKFDDFTEIFLSLLTHGANFKARNDLKRKLVHQAAALDKLDIVKWLIDHFRIDVNQQDDNGDTALHVAARWNRLSTVKYLVNEQQASRTIMNNKNQLAGDAKNALPEIQALLPSQETFNLLQPQYSLKELLKHPHRLFKHPKSSLRALVPQLPGLSNHPGLRL